MGRNFALRSPITHKATLVSFYKLPTIHNLEAKPEPNLQQLKSNCLTDTWMSKRLQFWYVSEFESDLLPSIIVAIADWYSK